MKTLSVTNQNETPLKVGDKVTFKGIDGETIEDEITYIDSQVIEGVEYSLTSLYHQGLLSIVKYQISTEEEAWDTFIEMLEECNITFETIIKGDMFLDYRAREEAFQIWVDAGQKDGTIHPKLYYP